MADNRVIVGASIKDGVSGPLDKIKDKFQVLGKTTAGQGIIAGVAAGATVKAWGLVDRALSSAVDFMGDSIQAASDMNETVNKSKVIFGSSAAAIEKFGDSAAKSIGQSKEQAIAAAAQFGNLFNTIGVGQGKAATMSVEMVKLASDLASFNNIDPTEALAKLQSGLVGEAKPLRELGILLNETQVKAKMVALGFKPVNGEFTEGQKVMARYNLILEQSTTAQGDFARTADDLANSQRIANAEFRDAQVALGEKMLPAQLAVTKAQVSFFDGLNAVGDVLANKHTPAYLALGKLLGVYTEDELRAELATLKHAEALVYMSDATKDDAVPALEDLSGELGDAKTATEKFISPLDRARTKLRDAASAAGDLKGYINDLATALFGTAVTAGDLAQAQKDLNDTMKEGPASKSAQDMAIYNGKLAEGKARVLELQGALALAEGPQAFKAWLDTTTTSLGLTNAQAQTLIDTITRLAGVSGNLPAGIGLIDSRTSRTSVSARAAGGPVTGGTPYLIGEQGPELFVPRSSGVVIPASDGGAPATGGGSGGGGSGSPVVIQLQLDGRMLAEIVDRQLYYARPRVGLLGR